MIGVDNCSGQHCGRLVVQVCSSLVEVLLTLVWRSEYSCQIPVPPRLLLLELSATKQKQENNLEAQEALAGRPRPRADGCHTHRQGSSLQSNLLRGANVPPPKSFALISPPLVPPPIRPQHVAAGDKLRDCLPSPPPTQATCSSPTLSLPIGWVSKEGETS
ncbi:hypothetical protein C0Q70_09945 [Pomacea canaliculata]|uniref:Uncharacterized protein n=1 Tax=Pomacea canaliculata TaxID=400727 RepID=A0A2T7PB89_POMCA|nr:hypothetical protein C0Q70_09945 [Pomacea canaliculata]